MPYGIDAVIVEPWAGFSVDEAPHTTAKHPLGTKVHDTVGREYLYVKFGAAVAQYEAVQPSATATPYTAVVKTSAANQGVLGTYFHPTSAANNDYGWVIRGGTVVVKAPAGVVAGNQLTTGATGGTVAVLTAAANPKLIALTATDTPVTGTVSALFV